MIRTLLLVFPFLAAAQTQIMFKPPVRLHTGVAPQTVLIADVNGDSHPDILVANIGSSSLSVFLGDGQGNFTPSRGSPFRAGEAPNDLALGDFNQDGKLDVAIANHGVQKVSVLLGDGRGGFAHAPGSPFAVLSNPHPHGIAAADFNGDGKLDLAVDSWGEDKLLVLFGNGDGSFKTPGAKFSVGHAPYQRLRTADFNEDGHPDLITSNWRGDSISLMLGDGKGGFSLAGGKHLPVPSSPFGLAVGDFNGDQHADIAVVHYSGQSSDRSRNALTVLYGDGTGKFTTAAGSPYAVGHYPPTVTAGDINNDGIDDVAIPNHVDNTVSIYLGGKAGLKEAHGSPLKVGHGPQCVAIGDVNGDHKADLVVSDSDDDEILIFFAK
jgi:hypothetical protein